MSGVVLDCSVVAAWCFEDEADAATDALLDCVAADGAVVPPLWACELANLLAGAERRGRIDAGRGSTILDLLAALPIAVDPRPAAELPRLLVDLARATGLTAYDAAYLEVALRTGMPLATRDAALARAAAAAGVPLVLAG